MRTGFHFDYSDLPALCADRELVTPEIHASNDFYGQASVLKRFAGIDEVKSLKVVLEHGIRFDDQMWDHDRDSVMPVILSPSAWRAGVHRRLSGKKTIPVGFGYLYAQKLLDGIAGRETHRKGTLAFPCHSTHTILAKLDHADYARRLLELPDFMQPVSVCMYWKNFLLRENEPYEKAGINVYSAGHMFDRDFLLRFHDLCRHHRYSTSNVVGSHLFFAVSSGCRFVFTESDPVDWEIPASQLAHCSRGSEGFRQRSSQAMDLFGSSLSGEDVTSLEQQQFVDELIGTDYCLDPRGLRKRIKQAETAYGFQQVHRWFRRRLTRIGKLGNSVRKRLPWRKAA